MAASARRRTTAHRKRHRRRSNVHKLPLLQATASPNDPFRDDYHGMNNLRPFLAAAGIAMLAAACAIFDGLLAGFVKEEQPNE